jgi:hypothetical protein
MRPRRAARRAATAVPPAVGEHGPSGRVGQWCDAHAAPIDVDRIPRPEPLEQQDALLDEVSPAGALDAEHGELLVPVADADHVGHPASADEVDDGEILGQFHRFVQREQ